MAGTPDEIGKVVNLCVELVRGGEETVDSLLARYPEYAQVLRPSLEAAAWLQACRTAFEPRPEFASSSRGRLLSRIRAERGAFSLAARAAIRRFGAKAWPARPSRGLLALLTVVVVLVLGSHGAALAAASSVPGEPLYFVKLAQEQVRLALTFTNLEDGELHVEFARRRLEEMQQLVLEGRAEALPLAARNFRDQVAGAVDALQALAVQDELAARLLYSDVNGFLADQASLIAFLSSAAPAGSRDSFEEALQIASTAASLFRNPGMDPQPLPLVSPTATLTPSPALLPTPTPAAAQLPSPAPAMTATPAPEMASTPAGTATLASPQSQPKTLTPTPDSEDGGDKPGKAKRTPKPKNTHRPTQKPPEEKKPDNPSKP